ncbi:carbamoyl-phosphate synthase subunit L [Myxococcota bacterium]|nr:carbamoyl-phosphate synthase subunit L [Myxococcota bacterium]
MRLIHAARELGYEHASKLTTIALYTEPDRGAMFVREADEAVALGGPFVTAADGTRHSTYHDHVALEAALVAARAEAVWVGWGFVAEDPGFAELCARLGIVFIGPTAASMRLLGDKIAAKRLAESAGLPVIPWSRRAVATLAEAREAAQTIGYPVFVKASAGGGGRGIRRAAGPRELEEAWGLARSEAERSLRESTLFLEKAIDGARHVEVQLAADAYGNIWTLGERDASIQRRNQKLIEECPALTLPAAEKPVLEAAAAKLASMAGFESIGSFEFLIPPGDTRAFFLEANPRLQVEHAVTELVYGTDLVKLQLALARGERLQGSAPEPRGHAVEVRICAEDADRGFAPTPGDVLLLRLPTGPGLRVDRGLTERERIPPEFDSMIAKIIAHGATRAEALSRLRRALLESFVVIEGGTTNKAFLLDLLSKPELEANATDTGWLERSMSSGTIAVRPHASVALVQAAIAAADDEELADRERFYASAARMRPELRTEVGRRIELLHAGTPHTLVVFRTSERTYTVEHEGRRVVARVDPLGRFERRLTIGARRHRTVSLVQGPDHLVEVEGVPHRFSRDDGGIVRATSPAVVVSIDVREGDTVEAGQPIAVLEAMKMEMTIVAPAGGVVRRAFTTANAQVGPGDALVQISDVDRSKRKHEQPAISLDDLVESRPRPELGITERVRQNLAGLRALALGFDVPAAEAKRLVEEHRALSSVPTDHEDERNALEDEILEIFADLASAFRRPQRRLERDLDVHAESPAHLAAFLATLDPTAPGIPPRFLQQLSRALRHYGVSSLERSDALEQALYRLYTAEQRFEVNAPALLALLERKLDLHDSGLREPGPRLLETLDRLVRVTDQRIPAAHDLARDVRYRFFDQPLFEARRRVVYQDAEARLALLERADPELDYSDHITALVACPQPLAALCNARFAQAGPLERTRLLEVLTRRHYRLRELELPAVGTNGSTSWFTATYTYDGQTIQVVATHAELSRIDRAIIAVAPVIDAIPSDIDVVLDVYAQTDGNPGTTLDTDLEVQKAITSVKLPRQLRRLVIALTHGDRARTTQHFTYRPGEHGGYAEQRDYRGIHPMMAKRLELWRLSNFDIERMRSAEDVYLFHAVARDNPKDRRLFAFCEVRDLTPVRDPAGKIIALPHFERLFHEAVAAIRHVQAKRPPDDRLYWNRIHLDLRGPLALTSEERFHLAQKLGAAAEGLGLQKVTVRGHLVDPDTGTTKDSVISISNPGGDGVALKVSTPSNDPIKPLSEYDRKIVRMRERGLVYPYEIVEMLAPSSKTAESDLAAGKFVELDLDASNHLAPVQRPLGKNTSNIVVGLVTNFPPSHPDGMTRVAILGDGSRDMGAIAEPECRRIMEALDLAHSMKVPVEWFALSAGAKISMESGTENMDWISRVLRKIIERTEEGLEINIVVTGINVGAQPYWNAEATMLMHTKGILVMTESGAMVLTGKTALDYSGSVSAADNFGIGGYDRIMGPNGQAQYFARNVHDACRILLAHYQHTYVVPGERFPRDLPTVDPETRDVREHPLSGDDGLATVGDVFSEEKNPGRKKPFDIRSVMLAVIDHDHAPLERWGSMLDAETAVVWDAHLGGHSVCLLGMESRPLPRLGFVPNDGPERWTAGTLFPLSSKKVARAVNSASGNRPLVMLANLSGFDGSPESMRKLQLEYGAEIGRAVTKFRGPIVFVVISRYHGGAFVVFSKALNEGMEAVALEGAHASVIGGAPAAAVVFAREVDQRTAKDPRVAGLEKAVASAPDAEKRKLRAELLMVRREVRSEKLGQVADEFDAIHSVERARRVGSLDDIISPARLRPYLIEAVERGITRELGRLGRGA